MKTLISTISLAVLLFTSTAFSAQHIVLDKIDVVDGALVISYNINDLLDEKSVGALQRGIKSEIVHSIQLWLNKGMINSVAEEQEIRLVVYWDSWEKKYRIENKNEDGYRLTTNVEKVKERCSQVDNFIIIDLDELEKNKKYYVAVNVDFQLISAESYNAISDIFSGGKKKSTPTKKSGFVSMFVNLLGMGDKEFSYKSKEFTISNAGDIEYVD
jgi:hypothetical protein